MTRPFSEKYWLMQYLNRPKIAVLEQTKEPGSVWRLSKYQRGFSGKEKSLKSNRWRRCGLSTLQDATLHQVVAMLKTLKSAPT